MTQVTLSPDALALLRHYEVQQNIADEAKREREVYERGVKAMQDAKGIDPSNYSVNSITLPNGKKWYNSL